MWWTVDGESARPFEHLATSPAHSKPQRRSKTAAREGGQQSDKAQNEYSGLVAMKSVGKVDHGAPKLGCGCMMRKVPSAGTSVYFSQFASSR
ncbi:hypothetical protein RB213_002424 [Colletotrichum asianum]